MRVLLIAGLCAGALAAAAGAEELPRERTEVRVKVPTPDYSDPEAMRELHGKLWAAAKRACDSGAGGDLEVWDQDRACARKALDRTVRRMNRPVLSMVHAEATGRAAPVQSRAMAASGAP